MYFLWSSCYSSLCTIPGYNRPPVFAHSTLSEWSIQIFYTTIFSTIFFTLNFLHPSLTISLSKHMYAVIRCPTLLPNFISTLRNNLYNIKYVWSTPETTKSVGNYFTYTDILRVYFILKVSLALTISPISWLFNDKLSSTYVNGIDVQEYLERIWKNPIVVHFKIQYFLQGPKS